MYVTALLRYKHISNSSPCEVHHSRVFNTFTELCNCHHDFGTFSSPQKETLNSVAVTPSGSLCISSPPAPAQTWRLATANVSFLTAVPFLTTVSFLSSGGQASYIKVVSGLLLPSGGSEAETTQASPWAVGGAGSPSPCRFLACNCLPSFTVSVLTWSSCLCDSLALCGVTKTTVIGFGLPSPHPPSGMT